MVNKMNIICGTIALTVATDAYPDVHKYEIIYAHIPNANILIISPILDTEFCIIKYNNVRIVNNRYILVAVQIAIYITIIILL